MNVARPCLVLAVLSAAVLPPAGAAPRKPLSKKTASRKPAARPAPPKRDLGMALVNAVQAMDAARVRALLTAGANPNSRDREGSTPLMFAVSSGQDDVVRLLLDKRANPNLKNQAGDTALLKGLQFRELDLVKLLVQRGADPNLADAQGVTPLMRAASGLLEFPLNAIHLPPPGAPEQDTPQIRAAVRTLVRACADLVKLFLERGGDPLAVDAAGEPVWNYARVLGRVPGEVSPLDLLAQAGAKAPAPGLYTAIRYQDLAELKAALANGADPNRVPKDEVSPLARAVLAGSGPEFLEALLDKGAQPNVKTFRGQTLLTETLDSIDESPTFGLLLDRGADPDFKNELGHTPLMEAAELGSAKAVALLLAHNAKPDLRDDSERTALFFATSTRVVDLLLRKGADPNAVDESGDTVLMEYASPVHQNSAELVEHLLRQKVDINARAKDGDTALHYAVSGGTEHIKVLRLLLEKGADPNLRDSEGDTALISAVINESPEQVRLLLAHKADPNLGNQGVTPLTLAVVGKHTAIVQMLKKAGARK